MERSCRRRSARLVFLTEGGYRFPIYHTDTATQNQHVADAWNRVYSDASGVGMFANYGMYTDNQPNGDCGLRDNAPGVRGRLRRPPPGVQHLGGPSLGQLSRDGPPR